jgi:phospholipase C
VARTLSRRRFLAAGATAGAAGAASLTLGRRGLGLVDAAAATCTTGARLSDIEHVVILIQENRSFDHYFGTMRGVRGFGDHPVSGPGVFSQSWPANASKPPLGRLLPFHLDTSNTDATCTNDITHEWGPQHRSWNGGAMDGFVTAHVADDGPALGTMTMGYYTRADIPFVYALADAFTVCDRYHCSIFGPTDPNRLYSLTGTIDPDGKAGGPVITNPGAGPDDITGLYSWTTMPERLQEAGVSWRFYSQLGTNNNVLSLFKQYRDPTSPLLQNALLPTFPGQFQADVAAGLLPQVSWVVAPTYFDEHPPAPPKLGEWVTSQVLSALVANPAVWERTVLFVTYDENGGFFDHVAPPTAPPGTPGEYVGVHPLPPEAAGTAGPIGLGFRVPAMVVSPFSTGGLVCSDTFDHTSLLRFIETRFGVGVPNLSAWRRSVTGDLTSTLNLAAAPAKTAPSLPAVAPVDVATLQQCGPTFVQGQLSNVPPYPVPAVQAMPIQESGTRGRPRAAACPASVEGEQLSKPAGASVAASGGSSLPATGTDTGQIGLGGALALAGAAGLLHLRRRRPDPARPTPHSEGG